MSFFKRFSTEERRIIVNLHNDGKSYAEIAKTVGKSKTFVFKVVKFYKDEYRIAPIRHLGRPSVTKSRIDSRILAISDNDPAPKISAQLVLEGKEAPSITTIRRRLYAASKHGRVARKLPYVSKANIAKRMQFYLRHVFMPPAYWNRVLWTDESMIRLRCSNGRIYVLRKVGEELHYKCTRPSLKNFEQGVMVWGCLSSYGVGKIVILDGKVNADVYFKLLSDVIIPEGRRLIGEDFVFQQDNVNSQGKKGDGIPPTTTGGGVGMAATKSRPISDREHVGIAQKPHCSHTANKFGLAQGSHRGHVDFFYFRGLPKVHPIFPNRLATMSHRNGGHCGY